MMSQTKIALSGYKENGIKPPELMSEIEKMDFTKDTLLPALEEAMLNRTDTRENESSIIPPSETDKPTPDEQNSMGGSQRFTRPGSVSAAKRGTLNYTFAHIFFPMVCLGNKRETHKKLSSQKANGHIAKLWQRVGNKLGKLSPGEGPELIKRVSINKGISLFIIKLPKPMLVPEAFFIGVATKSTKAFLSTKIDDIRYFTLELGLNIYTNQPEYHFCEWVGTVNPKHQNFGRIEKPSVHLFVSEIRKVT